MTLYLPFWFKDKINWKKRKCNWHKVKIEQTIQINVVMNFRNIGNQYFKQHKMHHMILIKAAILMCCCVFITCGWTPSFCSDYQLKERSNIKEKKEEWACLYDWFITCLFCTLIYPTTRSLLKSKMEHLEVNDTR